MTKMLKLVWVDPQGQMYHTQELRPTAAKKVLKEAGVLWYRFPDVGISRLPLYMFSAAEVYRKPRGASGFRRRHGGEPAVLITTPDAVKVEGAA